MKLLTLFLTVPRSAEPGEIQIYAYGEAGHADYHSRLPFFENRNQWRTTMIDALGAVAFESNNFDQEEVEWMKEQGWLTQKGNHFDPQLLKKIGKDIYNTLFPPGDGRDLLTIMLRSLDKGEQLHIQIQFNEKIDQRGRLPDYPWELACDDRGFLAGRQVTFSRLIAFVQNIPKLPSVNKIKVLLVSSPVGDTDMGLVSLDYQEQTAILRGLKQAEAEGTIEVETLKSPTFKEFGDYLTQISEEKTPHLIHFDGHGFFGKRCNQEQCHTIHDDLTAKECRKCGYPLDPSPQGYLLFKPNQKDSIKEADYISATEISELIQKSNLDLEQQPDQGIRLVVMSACQTGKALGSDSVFNGVAQKLIEQQIPAVVAMQYNVTVNGATAFAERFYRALGNKKVLTTAVSMGQAQMGREGNQWYRPVLYLRWSDKKGGQLFGKKPDPVIPENLQKTPIENPGYPTEIPPKKQKKGQHKKKVLKQFSFEVLTVDRRGVIIKGENKQANYFTQDLGNGIDLEMVSIPKGSFLMGSPETEKESFDNERPQHLVSIQPFFLGKYQVTQAQWRAVAKLPKVNRDLKPDPSIFKGEKRPVEQVSWYDAVEFCDRLSEHTGKQYRLPSEAEWEYACRAGTTTPFHYGETISSKLANYSGNLTYAEEAKGKYRGETTPVGCFPPNGFGLYDMHGNVWEWCGDPWHGNYKRAPTDGSIWSINHFHPGYYIVRGGSWGDFPKDCRSAFRDKFFGHPFIPLNYGLINVGFRVARGVE